MIGQSTPTAMRSALCTLRACRLRDHGIPWDAGLLRRTQRSSLHLLHLYLTRIMHELRMLPQAGVGGEEGGGTPAAGQAVGAVAAAGNAAADGGQYVAVAGAGQMTAVAVAGGGQMAAAVTGVGGCSSRGGVCGGHPPQGSTGSTSSSNSSTQRLLDQVRC